MPPLACALPALNLPLFYNSSLNNHFSPNLWTPCKSSSLYQIDAWGSPYFYVNEKGNMAVRPHGKATLRTEEIDLMSVIQQASDSIQGPLILRFPDILKHRLETLQSAFDYSVRLHNYHQRYQGVFPVKCNQDRFVVENIVEFGRPYDFGLEAGSKPELLIAMTYLCKGSPKGLLICNGYKDSEYVGLALTARQLGLNSVIVLEQAEELDLVINMSRQLGIHPVIGVRAKLNTSHGGHFGETSGEKGKFGLTCMEMLSVTEKLRHMGMLDCLQLLHFHIGSQIPSLSVLNDGVTEAAHIYCELALIGANMIYIDVGGGLGIDYDGTGSASSDMSVAYTIEEYAEEVVMAVKNACMLKKVDEPIICSESGRGLVSHHSVLVFDVHSSQERSGDIANDILPPLEMEGLPENLSLLYRNLTSYARAGDYENSKACARHLKVEAVDAFKRGQLSLAQLATINSTYEVMAERGNPRLLFKQDRNHSEHTAMFHINLSVFKCMPDTWAIGQIFPVVPLHRLEERPTVRAILSDLTCDSDGKISNFIATEGGAIRQHHLLLHPLKADEPYFLGMFLGGAYQEALGGLHNMFGNPYVVHVVQQQHLGKSFKITRIIAGQSSAEVLFCMHHEPHEMFQILKHRVRMTKGGHFGDELEEDHDDAADLDEGAIEVMKSLAFAFHSVPYLKKMNRSSWTRMSHSSLPVVSTNDNCISAIVEQAYCCT